LSDDRSKRVQRVERELLEALSHALLHELNTPLPAYVSVTDVVANPDLRGAKVYFRVVGDDKAAEAAEKILENERKTFQKYISKNLQMRYVPVLRFEFGRAPHKDDIDTLLENLKKPKRLVE
jgi:ribosome-binding factor A